MSNFLYPGEKEFHDLLQSLNLFHSLDSLPVEEFDPKARNLFERLTIRLLANVQARAEALQATIDDERDGFSFCPSFTQYADFDRVAYVAYKFFERYENYGFQHIAQRVDQLEQLLLDLLYSYHGELRQRFHNWIYSPLWNIGLFRDTQIEINRINRTSKNPEEEKRVLREKNHTALQHNLFGIEWLRWVADSVEDADADINEELFIIIGETFERKANTGSQYRSIPDPGKWGEKFDYEKELHEFCELRASYLQLNGLESTYFDKNDDEADDGKSETPAATAAEENQQPTVPAEERKHRLGLYIGLAQTSMALRDNILQAIRKVFDPGNESLWGKIAEDRQNPLPYTDHDHTDLTPFFNLLGVLIRKGLLPKGKEWTAILDKLPNDFHSKNKDAIKTAVTNGSRTEPKPLARSIEHCLDPQ